MNHKNIVLSKKKKARYKRSHIEWFHLYKMSTIDKSTEIKSTLIVARNR